MREIVRLSLILMLLCAITGAALSATYAKTRPIIEEHEARVLEENLKALLPSADRFQLQEGEAEEDSTYYLGYKGQEQVGVIALFSQGGYNGDVRMMMGVDMGGKITGLRIMEHTETPGLGAKITEEWFISQFENKKVTDPLVIGQDVDAITGATISSRSVSGGLKLMAGELERRFLGGAVPSLNIGQIPDGSYEGVAEGFGGKTRVEVLVKDGRLIGVDILEHHDTAGVSDVALERIPERMVAEQEIEVDTIAGATFTSRGIIDAVTDAFQEFVPEGE
ncbi:MAG: RnfABCDGE type electron transport complex subunit G [Firmicutes bacterium]|nr:RnfABCDGE type electron transport complex subunit G [Bacillota bacterium]